MANKYIIEGAAFNGDGTSSAEATVAGGVGAWNTITYFEGATPAYGSLAAGDTVYIRSKTAAGADITRTLTVATNLGSSAASLTAPINWIIDGGTIWSGVAGTVTYQSTNLNATLRAFNRLAAEVRKAFVIKHTSTNVSSYLFSLEDGTEGKHLFFDCSAQTAGGSLIQGNTGGGRVRLVSCDMRTNSRNSNGFVLQATNGHIFTLIDCEFELLAVNTNALFTPGTNGGRIEIFGGRIFGSGATTGVPVAQINSTNSSGVSIYGMDIPRAMLLQVNAISTNNPTQLEVIGLDGGAGAAYADPQWGEMDSRSDGYYPTLNAFLPTNVAEAWSWRLWPNKTSYRAPFKVPSMKLYTGDAGVKTLTCNFLIADSFTSASKESMWLEVIYVDNATGQPKYIDTRDFAGGALTTSDATWSATTYGPINLLKRKIDVTTATSIKKDTLVLVTLRGYIKAASANDLIFVCPDVVMT